MTINLTLVPADGFQMPVLRQAWNVGRHLADSSPSDKNFLNLIMQAQVEIGFDQLVQLAKRLPQTQWTKLKQEVETQIPVNKEREDFRNFLLNGPTFSKKQLDTIAETRKKIDEWRTI